MNVAEILRNKPKDTMLYSPIFGTVYLIYVSTSGIINVRTEVNNCSTNFCSNGKYMSSGECLLFPSRDMRDWSKFAWKKGDVLVSNDGGTEVIFNNWDDDTYTNFYGKHLLNSENENNIKYCEQFLCTTDRYSLEDKDVTQCYINTIEKRCGGKLNMETLEIEKAKFKDGDVAYADYGNKQNVFIVSDKTTLAEGYYSFISLDLESLTLNIGYRMCFFKKNLCELRLATEEEKQQLFDALEKEGKRWNLKTKQIEDIKPKWTPKPFDKVLVRDNNSKKWQCDFFNRIEPGASFKFNCIGHNWKQCIPYNEETAHLIGTINNYKTCNI